MATEISSTKDSKILFQIKALKTNLLGKLSLVESGFQIPRPTSKDREGWTGISIFHALAFRRRRFIFHIILMHHWLVANYSSKKNHKGRTTSCDPTTFASVTELQYDRLLKWSKGDFTKIQVPEYKHFNNIPVEKQPQLWQRRRWKQRLALPFILASRCHRTLNWARHISLTSLLQSIKMSSLGIWPSSFLCHGKATFICVVCIGNCNLLRLWLKLGVLTHSFPFLRWQSVQPDSIVTEETYNIVSQSVKKTNIAQKLTDRIPWERGLRLNYTG